MNDCPHAHIRWDWAPGTGRPYCLDCSRYVDVHDVPESELRRTWQTYWEMGKNQPYLDAIRDGTLVFQDGHPAVIGMVCRLDLAHYV